MKTTVEINYWPILVASLAPMFIGFAWYSLLYNKWVAVNQFTTEFVEQNQRPIGFLVAFISYLVVAFTLKNLYLNTNYVIDKGAIGFILLLALSFTILPDLRNGILGLRPYPAIWLDLLQNLINFLTIALITYFWK